MKYLFFILLFILSIKGVAQNKLDVGSFIKDSSFNCKSRFDIVKKFFDLSSICNSKNEFELRLTTSIFLKSYLSTILLSFNKQKWEIKKYELSRGSVGLKIKKTSFKNNSEQSIDSIYREIFYQLKNNRVFLLPDQQDLRVEGSILDGTSYSLTYKIKNSFRNYSYSNPQSYFEFNQKILELKNFAEIVNILESVFK